jgi:aldose 1-epimerase
MRTFEAITLLDDKSGARARILPELGFNCYSFEPVLAGQPCEVLWAAEDFVSGAQKPSRSGIPILFPFAGRIRGTSFRFEGETYQLSPGDDFGNAIHGFVFTRPWRVVDRRSQQATAEFQASRDDASLLEHWPADFRIRASYQLGPNRLRLEIEITNPDNRPLPFWFGTHPYFRVPIISGSNAESCRVTVPASSYWELLDLLPSGRVLPARGVRDLRGGTRFGELTIDDVLCDLHFEADQCRATIDDPDAKRSLRISFGREFRACVVFTPPHREAVCIEPYTSVSNAFELAERGVKTGLRRLAPGETFCTSMEISVA